MANATSRNCPFSKTIVYPITAKSAKRPIPSPIANPIPHQLPILTWRTYSPAKIPFRSIREATLDQDTYGFCLRIQFDGCTATRQAQRRRRLPARFWLLLVFTVLAIAGIVAWQLFRHRTRRTNPATASFNDMAAFIASDRYRQMYHWQRRQYLEAVIHRMGSESFADLAKMVIWPTPQTRQAVQTINSEPEDRMLPPPWCGCFSPSFMSSRKSNANFLFTPWPQQKKLDATQQPAKLGVPLKQDMQKNFEAETARILSHQTPQGAALVYQFVLDA